MNAVLILKLLEVLGPIVIPLIVRWRQGTPGTDLPTVEQWKAYLLKLRKEEIDKIIAEGDAWEAAHPNA